MDFILAPWPWYVSGPLIAIILFSLLLLGKNFGMSANLRTLCTLCGANRTTKFFQIDWKTQRWNLLVVLGAILGGYIAKNFLSDETSISLEPSVIETLKELGFSDAGQTYLPSRLFSFSALQEPTTIVLLALGGILVGFGARYAGGCTSGHAISGLSDLQVPSLIAVIGFFIGGLLMVHGVFPFIFS